MNCTRRWGDQLWETSWLLEFQRPAVWPPWFTIRPLSFASMEIIFIFPMWINEFTIPKSSRGCSLVWNLQWLSIQLTEYLCYWISTLSPKTNAHEKWAMATTESEQQKAVEHAPSPGPESISLQESNISWGTFLPDLLHQSQNLTFNHLSQTDNTVVLFLKNKVWEGFIFLSFFLITDEQKYHELKTISS